MTAKREIAQMESRLARLESRDRPATKTALPESTVREIRRANDVIEQIALPWDRLFRAVESAAGEKVGLLGITPDQKSGNVEVGGEASDLNAMFDYVKRLQRQSSLTRVYLLNHKLNDQDPQHPIRFTVTASWLEKTPGS
jgi:Tfp pilus assembly protein PilN